VKGCPPPVHPRTKIFAGSYSRNWTLDRDGMTDERLDLREIPPRQRHPKIFDAFEALESGEALTLVNDHEPTPLYHQMAAEVDSFDAEGYTVDHVGPNEFIATLPKI
jgi:uncharacterized protein (DUF2249 family)